MLVRIEMHSYKGSYFLHVVAETVHDGIEWMRTNSVYDIEYHMIGNYEIANPAKVPAGVFTRFTNEFHAGAYGNQRFGQAFLNTFHKDYPLVDAYHHGSLWENRNVNDAISYIESKDLIDFQNWA